MLSDLLRQSSPHFRPPSEKPIYVSVCVHTHVHTHTDDMHTHAHAQHFGNTDKNINIHIYTSFPLGSLERL